MAPPDLGSPALPPHRQRLVQTHMELARRLAALLRRRHDLPTEQEDLEAYALAGLVQAALRFDPARGATFATFAHYRIVGAIWDGVREMGYAPRRRKQARFEEAANTYMAECVAERPGSAASAALRFQDSVASLAVIYVAAKEGCERQLRDPDEPGALRRLERAQLSTGLRPAVAGLPPRQQRIIEVMYGEGRPLKEAAAALGISVPWASRLHRRAVDTLRKRLRQQGLVT